jgi:hypothetical protein
VIEIGGSTTIKVLHHDRDGYNEHLFPRMKVDGTRRTFVARKGKFTTTSRYVGSLTLEVMSSGMSNSPQYPSCCMEGTPEMSGEATTSVEGCCHNDIKRLFKS